MKQKRPAESVQELETRYRRLCRSLADIGYISQGSVLQRTVKDSGRSGFQWTRKVAQRTVTVALSPSQYEAMKEAVTNERKLWKTIQEMERISRQIIFATTADTRRHKPLSKKVLGIN
jgi:hypothetical protein